MIKTKELATKNMVVYLAAAVALTAFYYVARPQSAATSSSLIFAGDEVVVRNVAKTIPSTVTEKIAMARTAEKAVSAPLPPPAAAPLPIVPPAIALKVLPAYPASALEKNLTGTVLLAVYVGLGGQPERIETKTSSGINALDDAARAAVAQWKFNPARQGGAALASWFEVPVRFEIN